MARRIQGTKTRQPVYLVKKSESVVMRSLGFILKPFTPDFMERFWTTMGHTIYTPTRYDKDQTWGSSDWLNAHSATVEHELVHIRQFEKWSGPLMGIAYTGPSLYIGGAALWYPLGVWLFGWPWLGLAFIGALAVLLLPLSIGLAYGRWCIERQAYLVNIRVRTDPAERLRTIDWIVETLWKNYMWTWPRAWARRWFRENA